jgi:3-deoxy-D-manno-octulosonate 8-phosphate phosphatase (KDO 8-P phosphatase)
MYSDYTGIPLEHICVMGNDVIDLGAMKLCGFPACPHDAHDDVLELCYSQGYVSMRHGGHGAFRELVDYLIGNKFIV